MYKNLYTTVFVIILASTVMAQSTTDTSYWHRTTEAGLNFSQSSLSNWAAGGSNSIAVNSYFNLNLNLNKEMHSWDNALELGYGMIKTEGLGLRKSDDKLNFSSKYGYKAYGSWYYSSLFYFKTQFTNGYDYKSNDSVRISRFLAPAYILIGLGMDYKPNDNFSLFLSPASARLTIVSDQVLADAGAFGVDKAVYDNTGLLLTNGKNTRFEMGAGLKMLFKKEVVKNVNFQTKLELFSNYLQDPQNIDIDWEIMMLFKVNQYIQANLNTHMIYDHDIPITLSDGKKGPRTQFKEVFGLGFVAKF